MSRPVAPPLLILLALAAAGPVRAESYNEAIFGDISNEPAAPTALNLYHGFNLVNATSGGGDVDLLRLTVPEFHTVDSLILTAYNGATQSFMGLQSGNVWTVGLGANINPANLLGWTHFGTTATGAGVNQNLLDDLATAKQGSAGFALPLGPGVYTMLLQDTGGEVTYGMRFNVTYHTRELGDFNGDLAISKIDLPIWMDAYDTDGAGDADGNGVSNGTDFLIWQRYLNYVVPIGVAPAPEPSTIALTVAAAACLPAHRRRTPRAPNHS
jgi:hypothetical protein